MNSLTIHESDAIKRIREFLAEVPLTDPETLARKYGNDSKYDVLQDTEYEMAVTFHILTKSVRVVNKIDVDMEDPETYEDNKQAKESEGIIDDIFDEVEMHVLVQQHLVSAILAEDPNATNQTPTSAHGIELWLTDLRNRARHRYWFGMTKSERSVVREEALSEVYYKDVHEDHVQTVRKHWPDFWDNSKEDPDPFQQYLKDQLAVERGIWTLVEEDILIVTDVNNRVLFANVEGLAQLLFDSGLRVDRDTGTDTKEASNPDAGTDTNIIDLMFRLIDMWSFFTPLPAPEANRHPVDSYIREIHPELDMSKANVAQLQNAKMCMAHYGFWSTPHDIAARQLFRSPDALFTRSLDQDYCRDLFPGFFQAAMGKATSLIRFLVEPLDPVHYAECKDVFAAIPDNRKLTTGSSSSSSDKPEDFLSLFGLGINGFTQRHHDPRDVVNGLAGLCTFGQCTGKSSLFSHNSGPWTYLRHQPTNQRHCPHNRRGPLPPAARNPSPIPTRRLRYPARQRARAPRLGLRRDALLHRRHQPRKRAVLWIVRAGSHAHSREEAAARPLQRMRRESRRGPALTRATMVMTTRSSGRIGMSTARGPWILRHPPPPPPRAVTVEVMVMAWMWILPNLCTENKLILARVMYLS